MYGKYEARLSYICLQFSDRHLPEKSMDFLFWCFLFYVSFYDHILLQSLLHLGKLQWINLTINIIWISSKCWFVFKFDKYLWQDSKNFTPRVPKTDSREEITEVVGRSPFHNSRPIPDFSEETRIRIRDSSISVSRAQNEIQKMLRMALELPIIMQVSNSFATLTADC